MNSKTLSWVIIITIAFIANLLWGLGFEPKNSSNHNTPRENAVSFLPTTCKVKFVFDGDTIGCDFNGDGKAQGKSERVRLLGIDTPETSHSKKNETGVSEPCSETAKETLETWIKNKTLWLRYDVNPQDKYERKLAFAYFSKQDPISINQKLVEAGLAKVLFIGANRIFENQFVQAEQKAQNQHVGLWGNTQNCSISASM